MALTLTRWEAFGIELRLFRESVNPTLVPPDTYSVLCAAHDRQVESERDHIYQRFVAAISEVQQKASLRSLLLERRLAALSDSLEKKEAQLSEVLAASNLDPSALGIVNRKLEVRFLRSLVRSNPSDR